MDSSEEGRKRLAQLQSPFSTLSVILREFLMLPGITLHYALRKRYIGDIVRNAMADGVTQVVNLGAGFDTLATLLHATYPEVNFIEVDHPCTSTVKSRALEGQTEANLHFLEVDFAREELAEVLAKSPVFYRDRPTLYVCEGVMMYLEEPAVDKLFRTLSTLSEFSPQIVFSCLEPRNSPKNNVRILLHLYLWLIGEPIKWSCRSEDMPNFLKARKCSLLSLASTDFLKKLYLNNRVEGMFHRGEYFVHASF